MMVEQLTSRIQDVINQLEHAMFLSDDGRCRLEVELRFLVQQRDKAREAMQRTLPNVAPRPGRRSRSWPVDY